MKIITKRKTKPTVKSGLTGAKRTRKVDNPNTLTDVSQITSSKLKKVAAMRQRGEITLKEAIGMIAPNNATQKIKVAIAGMLGTAWPSAANTPKEFSKRKQRYAKPNTRKPGMSDAKAMEASKKRKKAATRTKKK